MNSSQWLILRKNHENESRYGIQKECKAKHEILFFGKWLASADLSFFEVLPDCSKSNCIPVFA